MSLDGFTPYKEEDAAKYNRLRWWPGIPLCGILDKAADIYPEKEALVDGKKRFTYAQLKNHIDKLAIGFINLGIKPLDRIFVQLPNWAEFIYTYFALQKIGAIPILLLAKHRQNEIRHLLQLTEANYWWQKDIIKMIICRSSMMSYRKTLILKMSFLCVPHALVPF